MLYKQIIQGWVGECILFLCHSYNVIDWNIDTRTRRIYFEYIIVLSYLLKFDAIFIYDIDMKHYTTTKPEHQNVNDINDFKNQLPTQRDWFFNHTPSKQANTESSNSWPIILEITMDKSSHGR